MRKLVTFIVLQLCLALPPLYAQQYHRIFLFDSFTMAQIKFRNRTASQAVMNYDAANKTMYFRQGEDMMEMTNPAQVDTIIIEGHKFVPAAKGFREVVNAKNGVIYVDWLLKDVNIGSRGALGMVTQGSVYTLKMTNLGLYGTEKYTPYQNQSAKNTDVYTRKSDNTYYITVNGKQKKIKRVKDLQKLFPSHKEEIKDYIKQMELDTANTIDMLLLINYCLGMK